MAVVCSPRVHQVEVVFYAPCSAVDGDKSRITRCLALYYTVVCSFSLLTHLKSHPYCRYDVAHHFSKSIQYGSLFMTAVRNSIEVV
jgi:hypothetical protein